MCKTEQNGWDKHSDVLIMKPRNSISSNIPAFKAIRIDEIIIKKMSPVEKTFTCARPMIRKIVTTKAGNKTDKLTPHHLTENEIPKSSIFKWRTFAV